MKKAKYAFGEEVHIWLYYSCFKIYRISAVQALSPDKNMDLTLVAVWLRTTLKQLVYFIIEFASILQKVYSFCFNFAFQEGNFDPDNDNKDNDASS